MNWFLIKNNEHLGPYSEVDLQDLIKKGEVTPNDEVWTDGWSSPKPIHQAFAEEFKPIQVEAEDLHLMTEENIVRSEDLPPELPPELLVKKAVEKVKSAQKVDNQEKNNEESERLNATEDLEEKSVVIDFKEYEFEYEKNEKSILQKLQVLAIVFILLVLAIPSYIYFKGQDVIFKRPSTMSLGDYERLVEIARDNEKDLRFAFSLATDKRTLWISTNNPLQGEVFINLKSKQGKTLGGHVEVKAKGTLSNKLITLADFQFVQGSGFIDGYYDVEIYTVDDLETPLYQRFFEPRSKQIRYINQFLITSLQVVDFEKQLELFSKKSDHNTAKFWQELTQKYLTIKSITEKVLSGVEAVFIENEVPFQNKINNFENEYKKNYGIFFTSFIQANESSYESLVNKDFKDRIDIMANYSHLSKLAEDIGKESMRIMAELEAYDYQKRNDESWETLKSNTTLKLNRIIQECERKIAIISKE